MQKVRIDGYGIDGNVKMTVRSQMDAPVIRAMMQEMIRDGLVPVIRDVGMPWEENKAAGPGCPTAEEQKERVTAEKLAAKAFDQLREGLPKKGLSVEVLPMVLEWSCGETKFRAAGKGEDVLDAQGDFMEQLGQGLLENSKEEGDRFKFAFGEEKIEDVIVKTEQ